MLSVCILILELQNGQPLRFQKAEVVMVGRQKGERKEKKLICGKK